MATEALAILAARSTSTILDDGGTQSWRLDPARARRCAYAVLCRNTRAEWAPPTPESHGTAFLVGRISDVVPSPLREDRWLVVFDGYAKLDLPGGWRGWRNPVKYTTLEELGIDADSLDFRPMPKSRQHDSEPAPQKTGQQPITIERAKQELATAFGVKPDAIEITIRG